SKEGMSYEEPENDEGVACTGQYAESFCLNGGTCRYIQSIGEYYCICVGDYTGHRCEKKQV
nr:RecName: Full=U-actitoxin-Avd12b; Short=U-AITX-Avd12b; AltName: Full=Gigantoxin-5; Short=Gigt 5; Flags: Precursor [Anemonia viridis]